MSNSRLVRALAKKVEAHRDYSEASPAYVSIYNSERCYGGPEEGGWWYTVQALQGGIRFPSREEAESWLEQAKLEVEEENKRNAPERHRAMAALPDVDTAFHDEGWIPNGWSDGGKLIVVVESRLGEEDNSTRPAPHYE